VIGVAAFDGRSELLFPPIALDGEARLRLARAIRSIEPRGDTCISCGLDEAKRALGTSADLSRIVLLTDGEATTGVTDLLGLRTLAAGYGERGLGITTIGLGVGYNEAALSAIALASNAHHHFVGSPSDLSIVFDRERQALAQTTG
jgi:Ca-activated chloride channel family protein